MDKETAKQEVGKIVNKFLAIPKSELDGMKEEQIKFRFIEPLLKALGWELEDINKEERVLKGRADYILRIGNQQKLVIEAKATDIKLEEKEGRQAVSYAHHKNIKFSVLTNFKQIRVYHALSNIKNIDKNLLKDDKGYFWIDCENFIEQFDRLWLLSRESFEKDEIDKLLKNVDKKLIKPIDEAILT
ncbi:MAG TPA: type I restriction enzyme HsdR N-terminal domain-containing protein, partial [Candidatus Nanoarchaeia archaeon]|nr:type I restriction enzyme HsdR N-terminal domain-containing protein [Candidatus Nanoarchaeia archaeon]